MCIYIHIFICICNFWSECNLLQVSFHIFSMSKPLCLFDAVVLALSFILPLHAAMRPAGTWDPGRKNCDFFHSYCWWTKSSTIKKWDKLLPSTGAGFWLFQPQQKKLPSFNRFNLSLQTSLHQLYFRKNIKGWCQVTYMEISVCLLKFLPSYPESPHQSLVYFELAWERRKAAERHQIKVQPPAKMAFFDQIHAKKKAAKIYPKKKNKIQVWCYVLWSHQNLRKKQKTKK